MRLGGREVSDCLENLLLRDGSLPNAIKREVEPSAKSELSRRQVVGLIANSELRGTQLGPYSDLARDQLRPLLRPQV